MTTNIQIHIVTYMYNNNRQCMKKKLCFYFDPIQVDAKKVREIFSWYVSSLYLYEIGESLREIK